MSDIKIALPANASVNEAIAYIDISMRKTVEGILETGYAFKILKDACEKEKLNFYEVVEEHYNINKSNAARWFKIGEKHDLLSKHISKLPASYSTIYSLITLPARTFSSMLEAGEVNPQITFEDAEKIKAMVKAEKEVKKEAKNKEKEINPFEEPLKDEKIENEEAIEGEYEVVEKKKQKEQKKKKLTVIEALERLGIDIDDAFFIAQKENKYTQEELIEAVAILRGE